jgi:membrane-associated PAP2 superfamily phosphatase
MTRTALAVVIAIGVLTGLVFAAYPELDLAISRLFLVDGDFSLRSNALLQGLRDASSWLIALVAAPAVLAPLIKLIWPRRPLLVRGRSIVFLVATLAVGPGLMTNAILKEYYGRPRPIDIVQFGGADAFKPWWDPRGACESNCSFVAGEPSGAFWTVAPAALAPPPWRALAYAGAVAFGTGVGLLRVGFGGHFFSDVVFAGVLTYLVIWLAYRLVFRGSRPWLTDATIERALERLAAALRRPFRRAPPDRLARQPVSDSVPPA